MTETCVKASEVMKNLCGKTADELEKPFDQAAEDAKVLKQRPGYKELGELYGLYKQAKVGDVNTDRPGIFDLAGQGKWDAWVKRKGMSKEEAMVTYIALVEEYKVRFGF